MFKIAQIVGTAVPTTLLSMSSIQEGNIHQLDVDNSTGFNAVITFDVGGVLFGYTVPNGISPLPTKINVPSNTTVTVTVPLNVTLTVSYIQQTINPTAAISAAEHLVANAEASLAVLPSGTINDITTATNTVNSSDRTAFYANVGAPDWEATMTYDASDRLSVITYAKGAYRYRQTLAYTNEELTSIVYQKSIDGGSTYTNIGTEGLQYVAGTLTATTWVSA